MENPNPDTIAKPVIAFVNIDASNRKDIEETYFKKYSLSFFDTAGELVRAWKKQSLNIAMIIAQVEVKEALRLNVISSLHSRIYHWYRSFYFPARTTKN
jgi:hypothetical protein